MVMVYMFLFATHQGQPLCELVDASKGVYIRADSFFMNFN